MQNNHYPKTSCPCGGCRVAANRFYQHDSKNTVPNNLAEKEPLNLNFQCSNKRVWKTNIQPIVDNRKDVNLNKLGLAIQTANYIPLNTNISGCKTAFLGNNQKLIDPRRGDTLLLDRPNFTGEMPVGFPSCGGEIYTDYIKNYGKNYKDYSSVNGGQIQYYVDPDLVNPYFKPVFTTPSVVQSENFVDPMGNVWPQYNRRSTEPYMWDPCNKTNCDSATKDQLTFREDLMERQMRKQNRESWSFRYGKMFT